MRDISKVESIGLGDKSERGMQRKVQLMLSGIWWGCSCQDGKPQRRRRFSGKDGKLSKCLLLTCQLFEFSRSDSLFIIGKMRVWGLAIAPSLSVVAF